jgi:peptidoglycan/LPS O-acetylase OafA/YrhL
MNDIEKNQDAPLAMLSSPVGRQFTLADGLAGRQDNFLLLRFIAASMVIYGHGAAVTGGKGWPELFTWLGWGTYSGTIAVYIFFVVSGFMIAGSYLRRGHLGNFLWARILRIFPAYAVCLTICAFVIGTIYTTLPIRTYLLDPAVRHYVTQNLQLQTSMLWDLPGVFRSNPVRTTVNGAIWTLPAEFRMYLWVALVGVLGIMSKRLLCNIVLLTLFVLGVMHPDTDVIMIPSIFLHLAAMFGLGAFCYLNREHVVIGWSYAAGLILLTYLLRDTLLYPYVFGLALAQFCFAFAYRTPWYGFNGMGDYSYGIYLWGFPVQQIVAHHFPLLTPIHNALISFCLAVFLALLSWHLVEKPALRLKVLPEIINNRLKKRFPKLLLIGRKNAVPENYVHGG